MKNEAILRGVLQKWKVECRADGPRTNAFVWLHWALRTCCADGYHRWSFMHFQERPVPVKISGLYSCTFKLGSRSSWLFPMKPWFAVSVVEAIWYRLSSEFRNSFSDLVSFFRLAVSLIVLIINSAPCWEQLLPGRAGEKEPGPESWDPHITYWEILASSSARCDVLHHIFCHVLAERLWGLTQQIMPANCHHCAVRTKSCHPQKTMDMCLRPRQIFSRLNSAGDVLKVIDEVRSIDWSACLP